MTTITLNDLPLSLELDRAAAVEIAGGFLEGLWAYVEEGYMTGYNNFFVQYEQNIVQQNPVNITNIISDTGGNVGIDNGFSFVSAANPFSNTKIAGLLPE